MTVVRITIKKNLTQSAYAYRQSAAETFSSEYLVRTDALFPSPQLVAYAKNIAQAESRLYYSAVHFESANVKLATPGASGEELRGKFSYTDLGKLRGELSLGEEDALAFPPIAAVYVRQAQSGRSGRLLVPHALTVAEWNLYNKDKSLPPRYKRQKVPVLTPSSFFSHELIEAVRGSNGIHIMPGVANEDAGHFRLVRDFTFMEFQISNLRPRRKKGATASKKSSASKRTTEGFVYLLQGGPHFKIGKTINLDKRLTQIRLQIPYPVEVVHVIRAANLSEVEAYWHRRFASLRQNGEWFQLTQAEVEEFKSVSQM